MIRTSLLKRIATAVAACAMFAAFAPQSSLAQILSHGDLFGPGAPPPMVGLQVGLGSHQQQGTYNASCGCTFDKGTGTGFLGSLVFELPLDYEWALGLSGGIDFKNTSGTTQVTEQAVVQDVAHQQDTITNLQINRIGVVKATYLTFAPYVQYQFFRMGPFVQGGLGVSFLIANHFTHTRQLTSNDVALANGTTLHDVRFGNGTNEETVEDAPITDASGLRLGVLLSAGYNIGVSERSVLSPLLTYDFPLTQIRSSNASGWKIGSLDASVVLKFKLD